MTISDTPAEMFRYQRLFGMTEDGLQMKVTLIIDERGRIRSASIQMRAVEGPIGANDHPSLWSTPFPLRQNIIGEDEFGSAS
jgi:hypothetical protein